MKSYSEIARCRICGNAHFESVLHLGEQALTGVFPRQRDASVTVGPVELVRCTSRAASPACGLVQLRQSYDPLAMYGQNYGYRSGLNRSMVHHIEGIVKQALSLARPKAGDLVVDIGSNDGTSLRRYPKDLELVGIDPTGAKFAPYYPAHVRLIPNFFSADLLVAAGVKKRAKIVTSIAMFYDLEDPVQFMREIRSILDDDGVWIFEQSYLPAMLRQTSYDTICHEHLNYYSLKQIKWMTDRADLRIADVETNDANGGSFRVAAVPTGSQLASTQRPTQLLEEEELGGYSRAEPYARFRESVERHRDALVSFVRDAAWRGKTLYGYGASTKGNVLLQYCGFGPKDIPAIAEINEDKYGAFTPGTHVPIRSEAEIRALAPDYLLVLPWHFRENIIEREASYLSKGGRLVFPLPRVEVVQSGGVVTVP
jgi:hypothetical protein